MSADNGDIVMNNEQLKQLGLMKFEKRLVGICDVYHTNGTYPVLVRDTVLLKDGTVVCQWENGTISSANINYLAMTDITNDAVGLLVYIEQLTTTNHQYEAALFKCKTMFEHYEQQHLAKGGTEKAIVNGEMVEMIKRTLGRI